MSSQIDAVGFAADDPYWYRRAVIYQVNVRSFFDADGNGVGDFKGITSKLDYLQQLGVTALWIMPFYPSPLRDDGYDISDYLSVNQLYGKVEDVQELIAEAHARGLRVITELIINHTSDQHPWFQAARHAPKGSPERDFYVWSDDNTRYSEARIIFKDFEPSNWSWDEVAGQYYWHRFFHHQPDLNFDNPAVHDAVFSTLDYWLEMGVDGFRLDAIPYLYEREGTTGENLPETHAFLKKLRSHMDAKFPNRMLLAEANQWPEDTRPYFGDGDECHMNYNFPIMPRLYMAVQMADRFPILDILEQTPDIPEGCQWAMFLRNHDELTLEMVTEEERDYMWRTYSPDPRGRINLGIRRRIAPLLDGNRDKLRLLNCLLLSMPGTPVLYYGDEIGMGDNIWLDDRFGVRTPMQWSAAPNAGFSTADPAALQLPVITDPQYAPAAVNVELQDGDPDSHLNWMRRILNLRQRHPVFGEGAIEFLAPANQGVLAYLRRSEGETVLVVANLTGSVQSVQLDLREFAVQEPRDLFGAARLDAVGKGAYQLTLPAYGCYWLSMTAAAGGLEVTIPGGWPAVLASPTAWPAFNSVLADLLSTPRYSGRSLQSAEVLQAFPLTEDISLWMVEVAAAGSEPEVWLLPLSAKADGEADITITGTDGKATRLTDAAADPEFHRGLLSAFGGGLAGLFVEGEPLSQLAGAQVTASAGTSSHVNLDVADSVHIKFFRRATFDPNPEWELARQLSTAGAASVPRPLAALVITNADGRQLVAAVATEQVTGTKNGWHHFEALARDYLAGADLQPTLSAADRLGRQMAELHNLLLAADGPGLAPVPVTSHYRRSVYATVRSAMSRALMELEVAPLDGAAAEYRDLLVARRAEMLAGLDAVKDDNWSADRIRIHGSMHLGNLLVAGDGAVSFVDWEGDNSRHLSERRLTQPALRDVATMLQSLEHLAGWLAAEGDADRAREWSEAAAAALVSGYQDAADSRLQPTPGFEVLLRALRLELDARLAMGLLRMPQLAGALSGWLNQL